MAISHSREPDILELFSWHFPVNLSKMTAEAVEYRNKEIYYYHAHTMDSCGDWPFKTFFLQLAPFRYTTEESKQRFIDFDLDNLQH